MTLDQEIFKAKILCVESHEGQFRRDGVTPYHTHPFAVAEMVEDRLKPAAYLHDVLEDTETSWSHLCREFSIDTCLLVQVLTRPEDVDYDEYIAHVIKWPDAVRIKIADMKHNLSCQPTENSIKKINKWLPILEAALKG